MSAHAHYWVWAEQGEVQSEALVVHVLVPALVVKVGPCLQEDVVEHPLPSTAPSVQEVLVKIHCNVRSYNKEAGQAAVGIMAAGLGSHLEVEVDRAIRPVRTLPSRRDTGQEMDISRSIQ